MAFNTVINTSNGFIYYTPDGGQTYTPIGTQSPQTTGLIYSVLGSLPGGNYLTSTGPVTKFSNNNGYTWNTTTSMGSNSSGSICCSNGSIYLVASQLTTTPITPVLASYTTSGTQTMLTVPGYAGATGASIRALIWNGSIFLMVIVTSTGSVATYTSPDGVTWTARSNGIVNYASSGSVDAIWVGDKFLLVYMTSSATTRLTSSADGITWGPTVGTNNSAVTVEKIAANGNVVVFVTGSSTNTIQYSSDGGVNWSTKSLPYTAIWREVNFLGSYFLASSSDRAAISSDGVNWYTVSIPAGNYIQANRGSSSSGQGLFFQNLSSSMSGSASLVRQANKKPLVVSATTASIDRSKFVYRMMSSVSTSIASFSWLPFFVHCSALATSVSTVPIINKLYGNLWSIVYAFSKFIGVKTHSTTAATSVAGVTWTASTLPSNQMWSGIATDGTNVIAIAKGTNAASKTTDASTWAASTLPTSRVWSSLTCKGTTFIAVALQSDKCAKTADGGSTWIEYSMPKLANWVSVTNNGTNFVAITDSNVAAYSTDGQSWTEVAMPANLHYNCVTWANSQFTAVASGPTNQAAKSTDGTTWSAITMPATANWTNVGPGVGDPSV